MIQRKQSLYLFFAGLVTLMLLFIPFGKLIFVDETQEVCKYTYTAFAVRNEAGESISSTALTNALLLIATSALSFITIFLYKKRKLQMKLISINMLVILLAIWCIMYAYPHFISRRLNGATVDYNFTILISFVSAIGLFLSKKAIAKDEALIRSTERLR
jgi:hypothetical protein